MEGLSHLPCQPESSPVIPGGIARRMRPWFLAMLFWGIILNPALLGASQPPAKAPSVQPSDPPQLSFCYQGSISNHRLLVVDKSRQRIMVFRYLGEMVLEYEYPCATGETEGDKVKSGDQRTPEGIYFTTHRYRDRKVTIFGDRALHLNYPNAFDRREGREGNGIYIHGTNRTLRPRSSNGCVVMRNEDLAAISTLVKENLTPVVMVKMLSWPNRADRVRSCTHLDKIDLAALDRAPIEYGNSISIREHQATRQLVQAYAARVAALRQVLGRKVKVKTKGLVMFGLGQKWVLLAEQELNGPKGVTLQVIRRFSLVGTQVESASLIHDQWVVNDSASLKTLAAWAPAAAVVAAKKPDSAKPAQSAASQAKPSNGKPRAQGPNPDQQIRSMLNQWLKAWQGKRLKSYIEYYASDFMTKGMNRSAWYRHKRYLAKVYKVIRVEAKKMRVQVKGKQAVVSFVQYYRSDWHRDVGLKTLHLVYRKGRWQIKSEQWQRIGRTSRALRENSASRGPS